MITPNLQRLIDKQIEALARARFNPDPVLGSHSRLASILGSAPKRHGRLIEATIKEIIKTNSDYRTWIENSFQVSHAADHLVQSQTPAEILRSTLPYSETGRTLQIDLIAYSISRRRLGAYEIKRANGHHDSGKLRSIRRDVFAIQTVLAGYGEKLELQVDSAISRVIFYYGLGYLPKPWKLSGVELDVHFDCPISATVDAMTIQFRERIHDFVIGLSEVKPDIRQLMLFC